MQARHVFHIINDTCILLHRVNYGPLFWVSWRNCPRNHDDVIKWKHFPRYWPFVRGNNRSPVNSLHKNQWRAALMFSLICVWINGWVNNRMAGDLRRYRAHYDVTVMYQDFSLSIRGYHGIFCIYILPLLPWCGIPVIVRQMYNLSR